MSALEDLLDLSHHLRDGEGCTKPRANLEPIISSTFLHFL